MSKLKMFYRCLVLSFSLALFSLAQTAAAQSLGDAISFAVLGGTAVTAAGTGTIITGDVGVSPGTSITGFPAWATVVPPYATHANDGAAIAAQTSVTALYTSLAAMGGATALGPELSGITVGPGVYAFSSEANLATTGTFTLDGAGIYIFKVGSALTANVLSNVSLINGATACDVFWQVYSAATLNGDTFAGTVVAQAAVTLGVGAVLNGRALTTPDGAVTMAGGNTVNIICEEPPTAISLTSFKAKANGDGGVTIVWKTASEVDNAGFNIYRSKRSDGMYKKVNGNLIPAEGNGALGASYSYEDTSGKGIFYKLEDVDYYGVSTMHGPVKVRVGEARRRR